MFGRNIDAAKIKMITTPNSLKLFKFAYKFNNKAECYEHWLNNIDSCFGICKSEKSSHYGAYNRLSYQMINSMPFTKDDIKILMAKEVEYIKLLKNDLAVFRHHIRLRDASTSRQMIHNLLSVNDQIVYTEMFKDFRRKTIEDYVLNIRQGKIKIVNTDYAVLCGNPYEMLLHTLGIEIERDNTLHKGKEIYCGAYESEEKLVAFRNPHIASGNVLVARNVYYEEFKYFNLTDNIVIINSFDNDIYDRLQGCDLDSDTMLISNNPTLLKRAQECVDYPTPVNDIQPSASARKRYYNYDDLVEVDYLISQNKIGEIVNLSQILNSYYWEYKNKKADEELLNIIYDHISMLSSLSQVEIDKAKKFYDLHMDQILSDIKSIEYDNKKVLETDFIMYPGC